jgi:hypothetical protein
VRPLHRAHGRARNDEGRPERCPCGSGKKFKRCCGDPRAEARYTREDCATAFTRLDEWISIFAATESIA